MPVKGENVEAFLNKQWYSQQPKFWEKVFDSNVLSMFLGLKAQSLSIKKENDNVIFTF